MIPAGDKDTRPFGRTALAGTAAIVGTLAGIGAILFWMLVSAVQAKLFGTGPEHLFTVAAELAGWQLVLIPAAGGLVIGIAVDRLMLAGRPAGVADVIETSVLKGGRLSLSNGLIGAVVSATSIGVGASVGREGPLVHLGATLGAWIKSRMRIPDHLSRRLLGCGVAAGIAASFNAPIAGAIFAIEVVVGKYSLHSFAPVAIGSISGALVSRIYYGDQPAFAIVNYTMGTLAEFPAFAVLGIVCAAVAIVLIKSIAWTTAAHARLKVPRFLRPAIGGLMVGLIALAAPQVLGVGYEATGLVLNQGLTLSVLSMLIVAKIVATGLSLGSGFGGGIFSPSVLLGAVTGAAYGVIATYLIPGLESAPGAFAIVGMGATAGAVLGAPLSTVLIVFEMTGDYSLAIAVMLAVIISSVLVNDFWGHSFFSWQLAERGIDLRRSQVTLLLGQIKLKDLMRSGGTRVTLSATTDEVRQALNRSNHRIVFVIDERQVYHGSITAEHFDNAILPDTGGAGGERAVAICSKGDTLHLEDSLQRALALSAGKPACSLPIVAADDTGTLLGYLAPEDLLRRYRDVLDQVYGDEKPTMQE